MTLLPMGIPVAGVDLSGEISATRFQRRDGFDELRARGFGEVSRAIPLYRSFTLVPYLFADVLGTRFERSPADGPSDRGRFVPGGGATLSADARKDFPGGVSSIRPGSRRDIVTFRRSARTIFPSPTDGRGWRPRASFSSRFHSAFSG